MVSHLKAWNRWHPTETIIYAGYADDLVLLVNKPAQAKSLLYRQEQAARGIGLCELR